jgi:hypothetical protein
METLAMECVMFKSPLPKLVTFFESSRDRWKAKCQKVKRQNKLLANQARAVEKSREDWRRKATEAGERIHALERELEDLKCTASRG